MQTLALALLLAATPSPPPDATTTQRGLVNTKDQAFSGAKTFDGGIWTPTINGVPVATTAPIDLFISTTGSDSASCSDAGPCATINGALRKLPKTLNHNVTVSLAAGTYTFAETQLVDGFVMADGVTLTIQGSSTWTAWTPASGTSSGTLTGFSAIAFPNRAIFTDSAQTWPAATPTGTAAALGIRGRFVCMSSGSQSGNKFPISAASPTTLEVSRTSFTGGNPAIGNAYQVCTPSTIITGAVTLLKVASGTGIVSIADLSFEPAAPNIQTITLGASTGGRAGGFAVNFNRVRARTFPTGGGTGIVLTAAGNYSVALTDSAFLASTQVEGGNDSTAVVAGASTGAIGSTRFSLTDVYLRGVRTAFSTVHSLLVLNGVTIDSENVTANVVWSLNNSVATSVVNVLLNCYSGEGGSQSGQSGVATIGALSRLSVFSLQVKGCQIGVDLGFFGGTTPNPQSSGGVFAFSGTTANLNLLNIGQSSPTTGAGVLMGSGSVVNLKSGTVTLTTIANGARDYVCPNTTTSFTEAAVQAATDKFVECQGAMVQR